MPLTTRLYWIFKAFDRPGMALPDVALEKMMPDVPGGTVRAKRLELEREGLIRAVGFVGRGRRKRRTWAIKRGNSDDSA